MTRSHYRGWGLFHLTTLRSHSIAEGSQGRDLVAGADAEAMEGAACWLAPHGLLNLLSCRTQDHNGLGPLPSIT